MDRSESRFVDVAVGIIIASSGKILLTKRDGDQHMAGCWEFPGGKIEPNEAPEAGLRRELNEELALLNTDILGVHSFQTITYNYDTKKVRLLVYKVDVSLKEHAGQFLSAENKISQWVSPDELANFTFPDANQAILKKLANET